MDDGAKQKVVVEEEAWLRVIEVATMSCLPMAIKAAINLKVMDILLGAEVEGHAHLSAAQIVAHMPALLEPNSAPLVDRILRLLASHGILDSALAVSPPKDCSTSLGADSEVENNITRSYGLNAISKYLVTHDEKCSASLSPFLLMHQDPVFLKSLLFMEEALSDGGEPFTKAHGKGSFAYSQEDARFDELFNRAMHSHSRLLISRLLDVYHGLDEGVGVHSLVDVGGGLGVTLGLITCRHPHIHGINFDQAHVISAAPHYPHVEHIAGDMFVSIPKANAIFMKWILHDWNDDQCLRILQNCYEALPSKGKVIVVDVILPTKVDSGLKVRVGYHLDLLMFAYNGGGRERTLDELTLLAKSANFSHLEVVGEVQELSILEIYKS